jgi:hypothetical protein
VSHIEGEAVEQYYLLPHYQQSTFETRLSSHCQACLWYHGRVVAVVDEIEQPIVEDQ